MAQKVAFSARKDPLLRPRKTTERQRDASGAPDAPGAAGATKPSPSTPAPARKHTGSGSRARPRSLAAVEEPAGVIAVPSASSAGAGRRRSTHAADDSSDPPTPAAASQRSQRWRHSARRVQTSMSLPPATWDNLDEVGETAGASAGELLVAILNEAIPQTPADALAAVERLLVSSARNDGPQEERNYRLPLDLRTQLDALTKALGPQVQRSLLIRALLSAHAPQDGDAARTLITAQRVQAMRSAVGASAAD